MTGIGTALPGFIACRADVEVIVVALAAVSICRRQSREGWSGAIKGDFTHTVIACSADSTKAVITFQA